MIRDFKAYIRLARPYQYVKNCLVFAPLFFAIKLTDTAVFGRVSLAFVALCLSASAVYIFNDIWDMESDRMHPVKKSRPLVTGAVKGGEALFMMVVLAVLGLGMGFALATDVGMILCLYLVMNLLYSLVFKHKPILDISVVALGFVLRLFIGAEAAQVRLSMWIIVITFLLALFLALAKRRDDVLIFKVSGRKMRKTVDGYNLEFLNAAMVTMAAVVIVSYIMYTTSPEVFGRIGGNRLYLTTAFVVIGILRYMQITLVEANSGNPTRTLLKDRFLQMTILGWLIVFGWVLYT